MLSGTIIYLGYYRIISYPIWGWSNRNFSTTFNVGKV